MRDYAKISCSIWGSKKFRSVPNDQARYVYFYLHTCPHVNLVGCFVLPEGYALADLKWSDPIPYRKAIESLCEAGLIAFDKDESVIRIIGFLDHDPFTNPKHAAGAMKVIDRIPDCEQKQLLLQELAGKKHVPKAEIAKALDSLSKAYRNPEPEPEPEPESKIRRRRIGASAENDLPVPDDPTWREQVLDAIGVSSSGMDLVGRWMTDLGLTKDQILAVLRETAAAKSDGPPSNLRYFTKAMQREAARLAEAPLQPASPSEVKHDRQSARDRRQAAADDRLRRVLDAASRID
jgi:hypothetical protein